MLDKKLFYLLVAFIFLCLNKSEVSATPEFSLDDLPLNAQLHVTKLVIVQIFNYQNEVGSKLYHSQFENSAQRATAIETCKQLQHNFLQLRLISTGWRSCVDDTSIKTKSLGISLTPQHSMNDDVQGVAPLIARLTFKEWTEQNASQINDTVAKYDFNNIICLNFETHVSFDLAAILKKCPKITTLSLSGQLYLFGKALGNENLGEELIQLGTSHPKNLKCLNLSANNMGDNAIVYLHVFTGNELLKVMQENNNSNDQIGMESLAHLQKIQSEGGFFKDLEELNLSHNRLSQVGLAFFCAIPADQLPSLKTLILRSNYFPQGNGFITEQLIEHIATKFTTLTTLDVTNCSLNSAYLAQANLSLGSNKIVYTKENSLNRGLAALYDVPASDDVAIDDSSDDDSDDSSSDECVIQ